MKKSLLALALITAGSVTVPTLSHAADAGFFVNGGIGRSNMNKNVFDDSDTGYLGNVGYRWAVAPSALIGIEGGYTNLGKFTSRSLWEFDGDPAIQARTQAKIKGWTLGTNGHFNITPEWYVSARGGWMRANLSSPGAVMTVITPGDPPTSVTTVISPVVHGSANGWYAGAGFGYDFARNMSVGLNYDHYSADKSGFNGDVNLLSVGAEVRF